MKHKEKEMKHREKFSLCFIVHIYAPETAYLCKTSPQNVKESEKKGQRKVFLSEVPVFSKNPCVFFKKACVFFQILPLEKLHIYAARRAPVPGGSPAGPHRAASRRGAR